MCSYYWQFPVDVCTQIVLIFDKAVKKPYGHYVQEYDRIV